MLGSAFDSIARKVASFDSFTEARHLAREEFTNVFLDVSSSESGSFTGELFRWSQEKLHSRQRDDRMAGLVGFAFFIDVNDDQAQLTTLAQNLDRILPVETLCLVEGIAHLMKRISKRIPEPIVPKLFDRCVAWLAPRATKSAVLSSIVLFLKFSTLDPLLLQKFSRDVNTVIIASMEFDDADIQRGAIELILKQARFDPASQENLGNYLASVTHVLQSDAPLSRKKGALLLLSRFLARSREMSIDEVGELFPAVAVFLCNNSDEEVLPVLAILSETFPEEAEKNQAAIFDVFQSPTISFENSEICRIFSRIVRVLPGVSACYNKVGPALASTSPNCFLIIAKVALEIDPLIVDRSSVIDVLAKTELTVEFIDFCVVFVRVHPSDVLEVIKICQSKLDGDIFKRFMALEKLGVVDQFPLLEYWNDTFRLFSEGDEDVKIAALPALCAMIKREKGETQLKKLYEVLCNVQRGDSPAIKVRFLELMDDSLIELLAAPSNSPQELRGLFGIEQLYEEDDYNVKYKALDVLSKLKEYAEPDVRKFFQARLTGIRQTFFQMASRKQRAELMSFLPTFLDRSGGLLVGNLSVIVEMLLNILSNRSEVGGSMRNFVIERTDRFYERHIRIYALQTLAVLAKARAIQTKELQRSVSIILEQLVSFKNTKLQLTAIKTLRSIFRSFSVLCILPMDEIVEFHQALFRFLRASSNADLNVAVMRLLGTLGTFDPHEFHAMKSEPVKLEDDFPLYDRTRREKSYLNFVMKYLLKQLRDGSKMHDTSMLISTLVYIFQRDTSNCLGYLGEVVSIFKGLLLTDNRVIKPDELLHFARSVVLVVGIKIYPYAADIYEMVLPYLQTSSCLMAVELLSALIFSLKREFAQYGNDTFELVLKLLREHDRRDFNTIVFLLLTITLLTIYVGGSQHIFFDVVSKWAAPGDEFCEFALQFLSQAMRCCNFQDLVLPSLKLASKFVNSDDDRIRHRASGLVCVLVLRFPKFAISYLSGLNFCATPEVERLLKEMETSRYECLSTAHEYLEKYDASPEPFPIHTKPPIEPSSLSEVFERGELQLSVCENDWSLWLLRLSQELVLCSNSAAIRASHPLLRFAPDFEKRLFPMIVVSVWDIASPNDREKFSQYLLDIIRNLKTPPDILAVIVSACEALDRANFSLFQDPFICGQTAERCKSWLQALRFFEKSMDKRSAETIPYLMKIHSLMKRKESALGLLSIAKDTDSNCEMLEALSMWSQARDLHSKYLSENVRDDYHMARFLYCSALLEDWETIQRMSSKFPSFSKDMQAKVAVLFAGASQSLHQDTSLYLKSLRADEPRTCMWRSVIALDKGSIDHAILWLKQGQALLGADMSTFSSGSYEPAMPAICTAMVFEELNDVIRQRKRLMTSGAVLEIWDNKAGYVKQDPTHLRHLYRVRGMLACDEEQSLRIKLAYANSLRRSKDWTLFDNVYNRILKNSTDERVNVLRAKFRYDRGMVKDLSEFEAIIDRLQTGDVYCDAVCGYCSRTQATSKAIGLLERVIEQQPNRVRAWKHWAYFNLACIHEHASEECTTYASNAMIGFAQLIKINRPSLHYLCQLCSLFFRYGPRLSNFSSCASNLTSLSPSSVIQIIPQLIVQFDHENAQVREVVWKIIENFAASHFQALAMPLGLIKRTPSASGVLLQFIEKMETEHHKIMHSADVFASGMLEIAVTAVEEVITLLEKVQRFEGNQEEVRALLKKIHEQLQKRKKKFDDSVFRRGSVPMFSRRLENLLSNPQASETAFRPMEKAALEVKLYMQQEMESITTIDIAELAPSLLQEKFHLAVPGFYSVSGASPMIASLGHVVKLIPSAKRPRKLRMIGTDGICYKHLLKGREDLRMDQRIMQLFSLTNSILHDDKFGIETHLQIRQVPIVPLAPDAGLIAWAEGGETIYSMIMWYRKVKGRELGIEQTVLKRYVGDERTNYKDRTMYLNRIQKLELHQFLCGLTPDDALREKMWLCSQNAELWLARSTNFARSNGLMSIVGYIMGIGDRHPSNILVMNTGNVVHIDFSECFEKASLRAYVQETVPFRLTRMLVRALGPSGVAGVFSMTAEYVMGLMRRNRETLLAFLDIFVQDPITDTIWYCNDNNEDRAENGSLFKHAMVRVNDKLRGTEFNGQELSVHDQVAKLIEIATSEWELAQMYSGWSPYW